MKITSKQINEIARELEAGMKVFLNRDTLAFQSVLDWDEMFDAEPWEEIIESSAYRELWFSFRTRKHEEYVRDQLGNKGIECE